MNRNSVKIFFLAALLLPFLLTGCSTTISTTAHRPSKRRANSPYKKVAAGARVKGTQKPYRINGKTYYPIYSADGFEKTGVASWYGRKFHGRKTANGETYDMYAMTAAHKTLPMNTRLLVQNLDNHREAVVRINDRGPFAKGRIIDLSFSAARKLGVVENGVAKVRITTLGEAMPYREGDIVVERFLPHKDFTAGEFFVQVGSFGQPKNAEKLKNKMLGWGKKSVIVKFDRGGKIFYRVQVRAGRDITTAQRMERVMEQAGFPGAFVVAR